MHIRNVSTYKAYINIFSLVKSNKFLRCEKSLQEFFLIISNLIFYVLGFRMSHLPPRLLLFEWALVYLLVKEKVGDFSLSFKDSLILYPQDI